MLEFANDNPSFVEDLYVEEDLAQRQEVLVFQYVVGLLKQLDHMYEGRCVGEEGMVGGSVMLFVCYLVV